MGKPLRNEGSYFLGKRRDRKLEPKRHLVNGTLVVSGLGPSHAETIQGRLRKKLREPDKVLPRRLPFTDGCCYHPPKNFAVLRKLDCSLAAIIMPSSFSSHLS